jgi:hypothetical protein
LMSREARTARRMKCQSRAGISAVQDPGKIEHRPWFTPDEYKQLYTATREYAKTARAQDKWRAEQVHDFVLFLANTGASG